MLVSVIFTKMLIVLKILSNVFFLLTKEVVHTRKKKKILGINDEKFLQILR